MCTRRLAMTVLIFLRYSMKPAKLGTLCQLSCHLIYNGAVDFFLDPDTTSQSHLLLGSGTKWLHFTS
jgi:hypothetical protein